MNRLAHEKSPYLLQHKGNPVDWYPWCDEAYTKAESENKPILLSVGYSTCHWCHVMAHESFQDTEVAEVLNRDFVCIKVDREERPDIDAVYMRVCQAMTGSGGWPMTVFYDAGSETIFRRDLFPELFTITLKTESKEFFNSFVFQTGVIPKSCTKPYNIDYIDVYNGMQTTRCQKQNQFFIQIVN